MKGKFSGSQSRPGSSVVLVLGLLVAGAAATNSPAQTAPAINTAPAANAAEADAIESRITRARALAAAHKLAAAAIELDAIRTTATDESVRDIARIMLMNIYLEEGDYTRADALLTDTFKARSPAQESTVQSYFALAGQTINGARHHLERYREFGINLADKNLPPEAQSDLERLRQLLERISTQATEISTEETRRTDAVALLEDVAGVRATVARDDDDRQHWQQEFAAARQKLAASETRIASISAVASARPPARAIQAGASSRPANAGPSSSSNASGANASVNRRNGSANRSNSAAKDAGNTAPSAPPASSSSTAPTSSLARPQTAPASEKKPDGNTAAAAGKPVDVGSLIDKATQKVNPVYPSAAKNIRIAGVVTVYLVVDENGAVVGVQRTSGPQLLRQAATDAARHWKFQPTVVDGQPVRVSGFISFNFTL